ncbi:peptidoglycan-binding protein LysM [Streptomyces lucensis JCM 4490]|uniref:Peptidoglycan-binding protein LysM n=1 Tax=Streptomyces lucensis JCM 4490 TaxID=1306176 RepID=A0A918IT90_9ACTN|nr:transglycosylase family protein [Streptomyces lucensis]GGW29747.1 peptidoglycan-binding protein LysM [Streptomyces lucensis JCM 4490]
MLSGNGRHRRPRQAPALLVAAGVTGSAIAIPLLGAASANAADGTTWDKVAECESGGAWSANTGNGYYGGLQISQDDWDEYGGAQYADSPEQASRSQQIAVAEKILDDQGTTPWATCALLSGLTSDSGSVDIDTGVGSGGDTGDSGDPSGTGDNSDSPEVPGSSTSGSDSGSPAGSSGDSTAKPNPGKEKGKGKGKGEDADAEAGSAGTDDTKSDKSPSSGTGSSQGSDSASTPAPDTGNTDNSEQSAGSWSLVDTGALASGGRHRGESADESLTSGQGLASSGRHASREPATYTVREGDSLAGIADSLEVDGGWRALYAENKKAIGSDPNHISAGQTLDVDTEKGE